MTYTAGDILLVRDYNGGSDVLGELILAGERARYGNSDWAVWTHSAMIVSADGDLVEALAGGVARTNISKYAKVETLVVSPPIAADDPRRAYAVRFALAQVGAAYNVLDFVSLAAQALTGWSLSLQTDKRFICSQLCARATEGMTDAGYPLSAEEIMPSDLGAYWHALSGRPLPPLSFLGRFLDRLRSLALGISPF